jgi:hypothetical protein
MEMERQLVLHGEAIEHARDMKRQTEKILSQYDKLA